MMDSEEEEHEEAMPLTGFLFGNINKKGELVDDVLDEVSVIIFCASVLRAFYTKYKYK